MSSWERRREHVAWYGCGTLQIQRCQLSATSPPAMRRRTRVSGGGHPAQPVFLPCVWCVGSTYRKSACAHMLLSAFVFTW
eukprot:scaffold4348_cov135-Isochrysis_galbana.AAC.2